jgi:hypothetical protein
VVGTYLHDSGVVNFSPALAPGESTYFGLEASLTAGVITVGYSSTLATTLTGGGQTGGAITVVQGTPVTDSATVGGSGASVATGTVTYSVYSNSTCTTPAAAAGSASVSGGVAGASSAVATLGPGTYYWRATYSGDLNNQKATSACGSEVLSVLAPTSTSTSQSGSGLSGTTITVPSGTPVTDTATIAGSLAATSTGTVSYGLYEDSKCTIPAAPASPATVSKDVAGASLPVKPAPGTYYWEASYSGDAADAASTSSCGSEVLIVAKAVNLSLPAAKTCAVRSKFVLHPHAPKGVKFVHAEVLINGKLEYSGKLGHHPTIDLHGLPSGTFTLYLITTSSKGELYEQVRSFRACVPRHHKKQKK